MEKDFSKIYSFSKIERFKKCPYDFYLNYLDPEWKGFQKPRDYKTKGSAVHGAITLFYHLPLEQRTFESLKKCLENAWFSDIDPKKEPPLGKTGGFETVDGERRAYVQCLKMIKIFFDLRDIDPSLFYIPTKDIRYSFCDYEEMIQPISSDILVSGKFDRIDKLEDDTLRIIDFKTGNKNNGKDQLDFYQILAELNFEFPVSTVSYYYLASGEIVDYPVYPAKSEETKQQILEDVGKIESAKEFTPKPSRLCGYCDFDDICPYAKKQQ